LGGREIVSGRHREQKKGKNKGGKKKKNKQDWEIHPSRKFSRDYLKEKEGRGKEEGVNRGGLRRNRGKKKTRER